MSGSWRAARHGKLVLDTFYFPHDATFFDVREGTREKFSGVKNPNMFLPLWAGVPLPESDVRRVVEDHMLNPDEFFRELPYPSLSYDNPKYDPKGYWRGRIWPPSCTGWFRPSGALVTTRKPNLRRTGF